MPKPGLQFPIGIEVALLSTIPLIYQVLRNSPAVLTPVLKSTFGLNATYMGLVASAVPLGAIFSALFAARWVDRYGARPVILVNALMVVIGAIGFALAQDAWQLFFARLLIGLGSGAFLGAAMVWVGYHRSIEEFRVYWAEVSAIGRLGTLGATAPLAMLIALLGWREALLALSIVAACVGIVLFFSLSNTKEPGESTAKKPPVKWRSVFTAFLCTRLWTLMVLLGSITTVVGLWGGPWLISAYQLSENQVSWLLSLMAMGFVVGSGGCVALERFLHGWTMSVLLLASAAIFLLMGLGLMSAVGAGAWLFVLGFCLAPSTLVIAEVRQMTDKAVLSEALFASTIAFSLGVFVYQALSGFIIDSFALTKTGHHPVESYQALYYIAAILLVFTTVLNNIYRPKVIETDAKE
ncbi:MFS transporter [Vibrio sp. SM6]|uniref:MFS transporter n=1 Tax=Vibrio agarilyticus TaxID=2726741 RepID=A0A7X8YIL6_9VIBR|nr:MFS transporter [Vibrio agarilyticus]NLS14711.1 MFS transporter [Vibrio agarilyticus]